MFKKLQFLDTDRIIGRKIKIIAMLKFSEELLLLALDENSGTLRAMPEKLFGLVLAGAVLCELAFAKRIGATEDCVFVSDPAPMGDFVCDDALSALSAMGGKASTADALSEISLRSDSYIASILNALVSRGVLAKHGERLLWIFDRKRYTLSSDSDLRAVKQRISRIVRNPDSVPSGHDVILVSLMDSAGLADSVFSPDEIKKFSPRIRAVAKMDLIARSLSETIARLHRAVINAIARI